MYASIYFYSKLNTFRGNIEDDLDDALEEIGMVSGGGSGINGSNIDIDLDETVEHKTLLLIIKKVFDQFDIPQDTVIKIIDTSYTIEDLAILG